MSLLDDVSIVVTPNGYKAGELYAVVPVPTEGAEEVVNGDFATDLSGWIDSTSDTFEQVSSWQGESGNMHIVTSAANRGARQTSVYTVGVLYKFTAKLWIVSGGVYFGKNTDKIGGIDYTTTGEWIDISVIFNPSTDDTLRVYTVNAGEFYLDNVSVKEYTSADMEVTRETAATRVDENGLVNYAEILGSEEITCGDFSCADPNAVWTKNANWTIANNLATSDGSQTGNVSLKQSNTLNNLTTGTTYKVQFTISGYVAGVINPHIRGAQSGNVTGDGIKTSYITAGSGSDSINLYAGSTFEGSVSNVSVKEVTRDNVPRIDYTGGGCPHILAEPQRTNLIPYSEDFNSWLAKDYVTVAEDTSETTSPSGNNTASKITINSVSTIRRLYEVVTTSSGSDYTFTLYAKKGTTDYIRFFLNSNIFNVIFDLTNGTKTVIAGSGSIEAVGNDWYRLQATGTSSLTTEVPQIQLSNSASVNDYLYIWGAQLEQGSYATSYIPTSGSTVTRNQDLFTRDGIGSLINSTEGVLFVEMAALSTSIDSGYLSLNNGGNYQIRIGYLSGNIYIQIRINGSVPYFYSFVGTISDFNKIAVKWTVSEQKVYVNGSPVDTGVASTIFPTDTLNNMEFAVNGATPLFAKVKQLQVYDTALTDTQLAALTS